MLADKNSQTEPTQREEFIPFGLRKHQLVQNLVALGSILAAHELEVQLIRTLLCNRLIRSALSTPKDHVLLRHTLYRRHFSPVIPTQLFLGVQLSSRTELERCLAHPSNFPPFHSKPDKKKRKHFKGLCRKLLFEIGRFTLAFSSRG